MKRYRICNFDFDARANWLNQTTEGWSEESIADFQKQTQQIEQGIVEEFGIINKEAKICRFKELGQKPFSILSHHNFLLHQIRESYVQGGFYPALTGACALGERILNHLILDLREEYLDQLGSLEEHPCKNCDKFEEVKSKGLLQSRPNIAKDKNCSNWNLMIDALVTWEVFNSEIESLFKRLANKRHNSLHFNKKTLDNLGKESLETIKILQEIIQKLFPAFSKDYCIPAKGEPYLKKELESKPFFKKYYIPNSKLVSPYHKLDIVEHQFVISDEEETEDREISDSEFIKLREGFLTEKHSKK